MIMAKKQIRAMRPGEKEFAKRLESLCSSKSSWQVWADFIECSAIAISNAVDHEQRKTREERYMSIMSSYTSEESCVLGEMLGVVIDALEQQPEQDFLGELFMVLELGSHWKGQFFTPYSVCQAMAQMQINGTGIKDTEEDWIAINDPACGAGALLVAARNEFRKNGIGSSRVLFVGQDIDRVAAMMCYIQLSLLGCAGYVVIADTLLHPLSGDPLTPILDDVHDIWFTPVFFEDIWMFRRMRKMRERNDG